MNDFNFLCVLGRGSFGKVMLAEEKQTKELYAIKCLTKESVVQDAIEPVFVEKRILSLKNKPPFLVNLHSCFQTKDRLFYVMEYVNGGDLTFRIQKEKSFKEPIAVFYAAEVAIALFFLHENGIIYRDLKLDNVMIDSDGHVKLTDFGMCKENITSNVNTTTYCGTPDFLAPEIILRKPYGKSVDWWAFGVFIYEMLVGETPFGSSYDELQLSYNIVEQNISFPKSLSKEAINIMKGLLVKNPATRLGCGTEVQEIVIKEHFFFRMVNWVKLENKEVQPPIKPLIVRLIAIIKLIFVTILKHSIRNYFEIFAHFQ
ncbi:hypothetical protein HELRODRAFT_157371 [Helobdella robusta]|uniref:protein kinase C n=1 Tax=Helobdella robusta TaxID=6412 RepID=T1EMA4_HELRO|nr:hypothetical protein HELRODRAFT_157371 [Helobdella robusta]ESO00477.1 hypothetical protein HELRODRAFT_157371 [Helobdella robusta]